MLCLVFYFFSFPFLYFPIQFFFEFNFQFKPCGSPFAHHICEIRNTKFEDFIYMYYLYFHIPSLFLYFQTLISIYCLTQLSHYYILLLSLLFLFNAQTYKLQHDAHSFNLVSFVLINHSQLYVWSSCDKYMAHKLGGPLYIPCIQI